MNYSKHYYALGALCTLVGLGSLYRGHSASIDEAYYHGLTECRRNHAPFTKMQVPGPNENDDPIEYAGILTEFWIRAHVGCTGDFMDKLDKLLAEYRSHPAGTDARPGTLLGMYAVAMHTRAECEAK